MDNQKKANYLSSLGVNFTLSDLPEPQELSLILDRKIESLKRPRDYSLASFSGVYFMALPFMKAGATTIKKGEGIFLNEIIQALNGNGGNPERLVLATQDESRVHYNFNLGIEAEMMAEIYLKTSGINDYESLFLEFVEWAESNGVLDNEDAGLLKSALKKYENYSQNTRIDVLNPLPGYHSKNAHISDGSKAVPSNVNLIYSQPIEIVDRRPLTLELMTPVMLDLLLRSKDRNLTEQSLGLSAFAPLLPLLETDEVLGIVFRVEEGDLKKVTLSKIPNGEERPPVFGPLRAMQSTLLNKNNNSTNIENLNVDFLIDNLFKTKGFISVTTLGAVASPQNSQLAYLFKSNHNSYDCIRAAETFVFSPQIKTAILLDPVAVPYTNLSDIFKCFKATRLCFYSLDFEKMSPLHQGVICIGSNPHNYHSVCVDPTGEIASRILNEASEFLTGEYGLDQLVEDLDMARQLLVAKYGHTDAFTMSSRELISIITGRCGRNDGLSAEVYSLFYQTSFDENPTMFAASVHAAKFLCDIRTFPQRFNLKAYLED